jgi:2-polyprenyl-6-methoxyphenol hydroxylase-like FAD-dependent oxidoreductase
LDRIGLAQPLLDNGISSKGVTFHGDAETLIAVDVSKLYKQTRFPTTLLISQSDVESIFEDRLKREGVNVIWNKKVVGMTSHVRGVQVTLEDGSSVVAQYVIGADGSQSTVRHPFL